MNQTIRILLHFECKFFRELSLDELYEIMALRQEVFVVEQDCPYLDADGKDLESWHLMGRDPMGKLQAYTRLVPAGVSYPNFPSIGRVITSGEIRGTGGGRELMRISLEWMNRLFGSTGIKIGAQCYLEKFYRSFGFEPVGTTYLEDGIPHIHMIRPNSNCD